MDDLTNKQKDTLVFIKEFNNQKGYQPTIREIAKAMGVSHPAAYDRLLLIEKKGYIELTGESRAIRILK